MSDVNHDVSKINTIVANSIEDIFKVFLDILNVREEDTVKRDFFKVMKKANEIPLVEMMDSSISKRYVQELEKNGIPYLQYEVIGSSKDMIIINPEDKERAFAIESNMRVQAGMEIDTKYELDRMMTVLHPNELEQRYDGFTKEQADFLIQAGKDQKTPVTIVAEKGFDDTYSIFCRGKNGAVVSRLITDMLCNEANHSKEMQEAFQTQKYFQKEKDEFLQAVEEFREYSKGRESYLFSYTDPSRYIHIREDGFDEYRHGQRVRSMDVSSNAVLYPDTLKFIGNSLGKSIYKTAEEVFELGGIKQAYAKATEELKCKDPEAVFNKNLALKKWVSEQLQVDSITNFNLASKRELHIEDFLKDTPDLNDKAREVIMNNKSLFQKQLDEVVSAMEKISTQKMSVPIETRDLFYVVQRAEQPENKRLAEEHQRYVLNLEALNHMRSNGCIDDKTVGKEEEKQREIAKTPVQKRDISVERKDREDEITR